MIESKFLDKTWNAVEKGGLPLCNLPVPQSGVAATFNCPSCKTRWVTIEQDGTTVWTNRRVKEKL